MDKVSAEVKDMCDALRHAAHVLESYAEEHGNHERAFAAGANAMVIRHKIAALEAGRISADFIRQCH